MIGVDPSTGNLAGATIQEQKLGIDITVSLVSIRMTAFVHNAAAKPNLLF